MKTATMLACLLLISAQVFAKKKKHYIANDSLYHVNIQYQLDSLSAAHVDTILVYSHHCAGCIEGSNKTTHILWKDKGQEYGIATDNYGLKTVPYAIQDVFRYFFEHEKEIRTEVLDSTVLSFHYHYVDITLLIGRKQYYTKHVPDYYSMLNDSSSILNYVFRLEYRIAGQQY